MFLSCQVRVSEWTQTLNRVNGIDWVFVYELIGCGFESSCSHLNNNLDVVSQKLCTQSLIPLFAAFFIISAAALNFYLPW